jgi:hypothetical protein
VIQFNKFFFHHGNCLEINAVTMPMTIISINNFSQSPAATAAFVEQKSQIDERR